MGQGGGGSSGSTAPGASSASVASKGASYFPGLPIPETDPQYVELLHGLKLWPLLSNPDWTTVTVATGVVEFFAPAHLVAVETGATDDIDTVNGLKDGHWYFARPADDAKTIIWKHGTGNLRCVGGVDIACDDEEDIVFLYKARGISDVIVLSFATAGAAIDHGTLAGLGDNDHGAIYYTEAEVDALLHAELHSIVSHDDTAATGAELETLTDGSDADALHAHPAHAAAGDPHTGYQKESEKDSDSGYVGRTAAGQLDVKGVIIEDSGGTPVGDVRLTADNERLFCLDEAGATFVQAAFGGVLTDTIDEVTGGAGVRVDGVLLKDKLLAGGVYAAATGSAGNYAISPPQAITAYAAGQVFAFRANHACTGASTLAVSGLATRAIVKHGSAALAADDIKAGQIVVVWYDSTSTNFEMVSQLGNAPGGGGETNTGSDLGGTAGTFKQKTGVDLEFRGVSATDTTIVVAENATDIGIKVDPTKLKSKAQYVWRTEEAAGDAATTGVQTTIHVTCADNEAITRIVVHAPVTSASGTFAFDIDESSAEDLNGATWSLIKNVSWTMAAGTGADSYIVSAPAATLTARRAVRIEVNTVPADLQDWTIIVEVSRLLHT